LKSETSRLPYKSDLRFELSIGKKNDLAGPYFFANDGGLKETKSTRNFHNPMDRPLDSFSMRLQQDHLKRSIHEREPRPQEENRNAK